MIGVEVDIHVELVSGLEEDVRVTPYPGDDAPPEALAEWLRAEITADLKASMNRLQSDVSTRTPWTDAPMLPWVDMDKVAAKWRAQFTDEQWDNMWRDALELIASARAGDPAAQVEVVSRCGPFGALLFCKPDDVHRVANTAEKLWLRAETAAWFDGPIRSIEVIEPLQVGDDDAEDET